MRWQELVVNAALRARGGSRALQTEERFQRRLDAVAARPAPTSPPRRLARAVSSTEQHGMVVRTLAPPRPSGRHVVYLHGGCYTFEVDPFHWRFVAGLARATGATVHVPIYPLAPVGVAATTVPAVARIAAEVGGPVTLMGDSAGGGLALAAAMVMRDQAMRPADRLVLIAPWLDCTSSDPGIAEVQPHDLMLAPAGPRLTGRLYAGSLPVTDPLVSPLFGDPAGLPPTAVFVGTHDICVVDARRWAARCAEAGVALELHEEPRMPHVYPIIPLLPQAAAARRRMAELVRG